jgi:hypothetical protein
VNRQDKILCLWAIRSDEKVGFAKLLRKNFPTNQMDTLQMLINGGTATMLVIKDITGEVWFNLQIIWDKDIAQKDLRFALQVILGKLGIGIKIEMAVVSVLKKNRGNMDIKNYAMDILEPDEQILKDKHLKWRMIKAWNDKQTNLWLRYGEIEPKYLVSTDKYTPYNIVREFERNPSLEKTIEIMLWEPNDITKHIGEYEFDRFPNDVKIYKGNNNNN